jgi:RNA polymerase sigma-70 factor (ECF subfamily)
MTADAETLENDRRLLWGFCSRMTGHAADTDDLVQETFVRARTSAPSHRRAVVPLTGARVREALALAGRAQRDAAARATLHIE